MNVLGILNVVKIPLPLSIVLRKTSECRSQTDPALKPDFLPTVRPWVTHLTSCTLAFLSLNEDSESVFLWFSSSWPQLHCPRVAFPDNFI